MSSMQFGFSLRQRRHLPPTSDDQLLEIPLPRPYPRKRGLGRPAESRNPNRWQASNRRSSRLVGRELVRRVLRRGYLIVVFSTFRCSPGDDVHRAKILIVCIGLDHNRHESFSIRSIIDPRERPPTPLTFHCGPPAGGFGRPPGHGDDVGCDPVKFVCGPTC